MCFRKLLRHLRRRGLPRPGPAAPGHPALRAWYLFGERMIDETNARIASHLADQGVNLTRFDLALICYEDFQRGVAAAVLPDSRSLPVEAVAAGLAAEFARRSLPTRVAAREWLRCAEEFWVMTGLGLKGNAP
jgi:hypothetical protein